MSAASRGKDKERDLAEILHDSQALRPELLQRAIRESQRLERPLWQLLLRESILPAETLFRLLRQAVRVPVLEEAQLEHVVVPDDLKLAIPPEQVIHQGVLPLERSTDGRRAALAMLDPTMDLTPLWPALARLGVVEVRRFLLNLPTLQRGRQMFYGQPWPSNWEQSPSSNDGAAPPLSAITQPPARPPAESSSVMVDPMLQEEIQHLSNSAKVRLPTPFTASQPNLAPAPKSMPAVAVTPTAPAAPAAVSSQPAISRPNIPLELQTTMPGAASGSTNQPVLRSGMVQVAAPAAAPTPAPSPSAPSIQIDLPELKQPASPEAERVAPEQKRKQTVPPVEAAPAIEPTPSKEAKSSISSPAAPAAASASSPIELPGAQAPVDVSAPSAAQAAYERAMPDLRPMRAAQPSSQSPQLQEISSTDLVVEPALRELSLSDLVVEPQHREPARRPQQVREVSLDNLRELSLSDLVIDKDLREISEVELISEPTPKAVGLRADAASLRAPSVPSHLEPEVGGEEIQDALMSAAETLLTALEQSERATWPTALARLCQSVGDRLGFAPRAVRELMLVAQLYGMLRTQLLRRGGLPKEHTTQLGFATDHPLQHVLDHLQQVLVDFMRLQSDEGEQPMGVRIVNAAALALRLCQAGKSGDELAEQLRREAGDTHVVFSILKVIEIDPPALTEDAVVQPAPEETTGRVPPKATAVTPPKPSLHWPLPPQMPAVPWRTVALKPAPDAISDLGLLPYPPAEL